MTKQEKIKEAYGEYWEILKDYVERNGWMTVSDLLHLKLPIFKYIQCDVDDIEDIRAYRPKTLKGIEDNNGWTKIEFIEDLPKEKGLKCLFLNKNNMHTTYISDDVLYDSGWFFRRYTHWKIKNEFKYPLY